MKSIGFRVQRMGNPLINELLVGTGFKDRFSMDAPKNDSQFASFFLDPTLARVLNAATFYDQANEALNLFPDYHYALAALARVRTAQGQHAAAVELLRQRYDQAPHPENQYALAVALKRAGHLREAQQAFSRFEKAARAESQNADNANHELVLDYVDHAHEPRKALRVAERELARRQDVFTIDGYAWALHANKNREEARRHIEMALAIGSQDPDILAHAKAIRFAVKP